MQLIKRWWSNASASTSTPVTSGGLEPQREATRQEVLRMAVRDTLRRHGLPSHWIFAEMHPALTRSRVRGLHLRLVLREGAPELLPYTVALQKAILARLMRLDPLSPNWIAGITWKFDVADDRVCPALPPAHKWQAKRDESDNKPSSSRPVLEEIFAAADAGSGRHSGHADFRPTEPMGQR